MNLQSINDTCFWNEKQLFGMKLKYFELTWINRNVLVASPASPIRNVPLHKIDLQQSYSLWICFVIYTMAPVFVVFAYLPVCTWTRRIELLCRVFCMLRFHCDCIAGWWEREFRLKSAQLATCPVCRREETLTAAGTAKPCSADETDRIVATAVWFATADDQEWMAQGQWLRANQFFCGFSPQVRQAVFESRWRLDPASWDLSRHEASLACAQFFAMNAAGNAAGSCWGFPQMELAIATPNGELLNRKSR